MFVVKIIKESSSYSDNYEKIIFKFFEYTSKIEANKKVKELIKLFNMKKIGYTFINNENKQIETNY